MVDILSLYKQQEQRKRGRW